MNPAEYADTQDRLLVACMMMMALPLEEFVRAIDAAAPPLTERWTGPASDRAHRLRALARGAQGLVRVLAADTAPGEMAREAAVRVADGETDGGR